jgi:RNA polymerase sigma factor (sigma-70 family)
MTLTVSSDQQLVADTRRGNERAFEELYERYRPRIKAFALRLTRDPDRADDLAQEVFISALRRLRATDRPIDFRPWIYEIARNACIDEYRRRRRLMEVPIDRDDVDGWLGHLSGGPSPEVAVEAKQQLEDLRTAFRGLSARHHRIIVARELEGKTYGQIGDELGMSQVVVESTLFRARRRLGEEFQDLSSGRRCEQVRGIIGRASGRRLGLRERRAVNQHIEHCHPCKREALAAGWGVQRRPVRSLQKVAAASFPVPLLRLVRRGGAAASRGLHQGAASPIGGYAGSLAFGSGRAVATAATVLVAAVGGGLITEATQAPARGAAHQARHTPQARLVGVSGARGFSVSVSPGRGQLVSRLPIRRVKPGSRPAAGGGVATPQRSSTNGPSAGAGTRTDGTSGAGSLSAPAVSRPAPPGSGGVSRQVPGVGPSTSGLPSAGVPAGGPAVIKVSPVVHEVAGGAVPGGALSTASTTVSGASAIKLPSSA